MLHSPSYQGGGSEGVVAPSQMQTVPPLGGVYPELPRPPNKNERCHSGPESLPYRLKPRRRHDLLAILYPATGTWYMISTEPNFLRNELELLEERS